MNTELQQDLDLAKELVAKGDKLAKLMKNREFKELVLEDYLKEEALRLTGILGQVADDVRPKVIAELEAISKLQNHFRMIELIAEQAKARMEEIKAAIEADEVEEAEFTPAYEG